MKIWYNIIGSFLFGAGIVLVLILGSTVEKNNSATKNNFHRVFLKQRTLTPDYTLDLKYNSYYLAGLDSNTIYLGNSTEPNHLVTSNHRLDTQHVQLHIPDTIKIAWKVLRVRINYPDIFLTEGITPNILHATFPGLNYRRCSFELYFSDLVPHTSSSFIFRAYNMTRRQNILMKADEETASSPALSYPLDKQTDGFFCTDGMLLFNPDRAEIVYVYYYRNLIVGLNSSLQVLYKSNTLDTISHAIIDVGYIESENKMTLLNQPLIVNKHSCTYKNLIYIHSGIKSDNESASLFDSHSVIDTYSLEDHRYIFSFYIPFCNGKDLNDLKVIQDKLIALHDHFLTLYTLPK